MVGPGGNPGETPDEAAGAFDSGGNGAAVALAAGNGGGGASAAGAADVGAGGAEGANVSRSRASDRSARAAGPVVTALMIEMSFASCSRTPLPQAPQVVSRISRRDNSFCSFRERWRMIGWRQSAFGQRVVSFIGQRGKRTAVGAVRR